MTTTTMDPKLKQWRWRVFAATWLTYAGFYFCRKPFFIVKSDLRAELEWDLPAIGQIGFWYLLAYTVGQFIGGAAGQRWGPRLLLLIGLGLSILANVVFGFSNSFGTFAAFMILNGLAQATGWSNCVGTMANWFHRQERGTVMGFWATNYQVGGVLANTLAAFVAGEYGFRYSFFTGSVVLALVWIFVLFNQRNRPEDLGLPAVKDPAAPPPPTSATASSRLSPTPAAASPVAAAPHDQGRFVGWTRQVVANVMIIGAFYFFVKFIRYALWSWTPLMLKESYGLTTADAGYLSTIFDLAGIAGVIAAGYISDKLFKGRRAQVAFIFIVCLAMSCLVLYLFGPTSLLLFGIGLGLVGFMLYGPDALMTGAGAIDVGTASGATLAAGIINGMGSIGSVVQEVILPYVLERGGVGGVFAFLLGSACLAALFMGLMLWRNSTGKSDL